VIGALCYHLLNRYGIVHQKKGWRRQ